MKQGNSGGGGGGSGFGSNNQGSLLSGFFNLGSLGLNFNSLQSQITAALLSGNQDQASNLIKQGLQGGNTGAVSQALASASANVSYPHAALHGIAKQFSSRFKASGPDHHLKHTLEDHKTAVRILGLHVYTSGKF